MTIGTLRKRVVLQEEQRTPDGAGGYALSWASVATVWAEITPVSGHEVVASAGIEGHATHKVRMRWRDDLSLHSGMRLLHGSRTFNIRYVLNVHEANRWALILAEEGCAL